MRNPLMVGERVYLRALEIEDGETLARYAAEESDTFMYRGRQPQSPIEFEIWLKDAYKANPPPYVEFAVCLRADDRLIGNMGVGDLDWVNRTGETGSYLFAPFRNQGYGSEAKHLLLEYAFDRLGLHSLQSRVYFTNTRSAAALRKQGYRDAGRSTWEEPAHGGMINAAFFDLLASEWRALPRAG